MKKTNENDEVANWKDLIEKLNNYNNRWIFRGQNRGKDLKPKFERITENVKEKKLNRAMLEKDIIREFRRKYYDIDSDIIEKDTLYALSVIRHFEGPTRLLDASYSKYVAIFNALIDSPLKDDDNDDDNIVFIWLINEDWCCEVANKCFGKVYIETRNKDRTEETFIEMYMSDTPKKFVLIENPFKIIERNDVQQGVFLCQGDISVPFMDNLKAMDNWEEYNKKIVLKFNEEERRKSLLELHKMNIDRKSLYPGKEGFIKDLNEYLLRKICE